MNRQEVYQAIDSEMVYKDQVWNLTTDAKKVGYEMSPFLIEIELRLNKAKEMNFNKANEGVMHELRKISALCVKCGEVHGMPKR